MDHARELHLKQSLGFVLYRTDYSPGSDDNWVKLLQMTAKAAKTRKSQVSRSMRN